MNNFESLNLSENLNLALAKMNFSKPTPVQAQTIPFALQSKDILGSAQTGTGKTAAFCIPMVDILSKNENMTALIMTPTRELARQVLDVVNQLIGYESSLRTACLIGGEAMGKQLNQLRKGPRIIVGTPGRINDHLERETLDLMDCGYLVLDETDRMLDMGFGVQIDQTLQYMPSERQTLLFSATLPSKIMQLSKKYLHNPERIAIESDEVLLTNIAHETLNIDHNKKYVELLNQLSQRDGSVLIFAKTKHGTQRMAKNLTNDGFKADALNGNLNQNKRDKVMSGFRNKKFKVVIDAVNGAGANALPEMLDLLGCNVVKLDCEPSGIFKRGTEPLPDNLSELSKQVLENNADIGFAVDPDADRLAVVDEKGRPLGEEYTLVLSADGYINTLGVEGEVFVSNLSTSLALDKLALTKNCKVKRSAVGEINVVNKMNEVGSNLGGEGNGGVILRECHLGRDSLVAITMVLNRMTQSSYPISEIYDSLPQFEIVKDKISVDGIKSDDFLSRVNEYYKDGEKNTIDGLKITWDEKWVHLRSSNTEPIIRIYAEAPLKKEAEDLVLQIKSLI